MTDTRTIELTVSGRLCLFGEHSDWAADYALHNGYCLVIGTDQNMKASVQASDQFSIETQLPDSYGRVSGRYRRMTCPFTPKNLIEAAEDADEFFRYCAGVAHVMISRFGVTGGIDIKITAMDLPLKKGVSSSAAVCILIARAFNEVYSLGLFPHELMDIAYRGELLTGSQCGRMDQACIYGKSPVLLTLEKGRLPRVEPIATTGAIHILFVDLAGKKNTIKILADLRNAYINSPDLQQALGPENERIVRLAYQAIRQGNEARLGELMTEAQDIFDKLIAPASMDDLASPLLHEVLALSEISALTCGGKGVGSGGDGTAQLVANNFEDRQKAMQKIQSAFPNMRCYPLTIGTIII